MVRAFLWMAALAIAIPAPAFVAGQAQTAAAMPLAHRPVTGAAGPFKRVTVTLRRISRETSAPFTGTLTAAGGRTLPLAGPDEPSDFFLLDVTAVMFTPIERGGGNGIVILYDSSRIGPGHGTDRRALVYRVRGQAAQRVTALEERLEGAASAAEVRRRLRKGTR